MTQQVTAVTWLAIPIQQQRQLIALLSQLVYRQLSATSIEERSDECSDSFTPGRERQDSRSSPGSLGGGLCRAIALCSRGWGAQEEAQPIVIVECGTQFPVADAVTGRTVMAQRVESHAADQG